MSRIIKQKKSWYGDDFFLFLTYNGGVKAFCVIEYYLYYNLLNCIDDWYEM